MWGLGIHTKGLEAVRRSGIGAPALQENRYAGELNGPDA